MIETPNLLITTEYPVTDKLTVHVPSAMEIFEYGDLKYYSIVQSLTATPFDLMVELDDAGIDYETISDYQLFMLMLESMIFMGDDLSIIFGASDLSHCIEVIDETNGEHILRDAESGIVIDQLVATKIAAAIREMHYWEAPIGHAGNTEAKRYLIQRNRLKRNRLKNQKYKSFLKSIIISLVNTEEFKYNYEQALDLSVYKLNASWRQIQKKKNWDHTMNGAYFGTVDLSKVNFDKINWLTPD